MFSSLLNRSDTRVGLSDVDWMSSGATGATLVDQYTLSGQERTQQAQVTVSGKGLVIERENEGPTWLMPVVKVMGELLDLPENWDSYGARRINPEAITFALQLLSDTMRLDTPIPSVVPTSRGGVQLEWHIHGIDLEIEIRSPGRLYVCYEDLRHDVEWEGELTFDLTRLSGFVSELSRHEQ